MYECYKSEAFESAYTYSGSDLGAVWTQEKTRFRLWAPTAQAVTVNLFRSGDPACEDLLEQLPMRPDVCGTWTAEKAGDQQGVYYTYTVQVDGQLRHSCDPYAITTGVNGVRAMILDPDSTNPPGWQEDADPHAGMPITDAVIYELHLRDLSMDRSSRIRHKGKFLALTESGRKTPGGHPVGLDHILQLGVTHVQLLPIFDFGFTDEDRPRPQYNWGYDPVNFNVPDGSYATDPHDGALRVAQLKQMIRCLHQNGISVVMDVVYNHVYDAPKFCFNQVVPGYFSRIDDQGNYSNGSCCGNDTASERPMVRKYIVDSVLHWVEQYHIDGFRFDLAGLIDIPTLLLAMQTVHRRHPNVLFYGEGWQMNTCLTKPGYPLAVQANSAMLPEFAFFNDTLRDLLRGSVFDPHALGYAVGGVQDKGLLHGCFMGMPGWASQPHQCINYVSCHDNHTLFDRIAMAVPQASREDRIRMNKLAAAFSLLAQGVPFFQAGEEMLRTKPGKNGFDGNSYRSPDRINALKWSTLDQPEYADTVRYYQGLIAFRKAHPGLRYQFRQQVLDNVHPIHLDNPQLCAFCVQEADGELLICFNGSREPAVLPLPEGTWQIYIQDGKAGTEPLADAAGEAAVAPFSATVLARKRPIEVVAGLIWEKDKFLICKRPESKARGGFWEFPGGKLEPGETPQQALARECAEELAITPQVGQLFTQVVYQYPDICIHLSLYHCIIPTGFPQALEHDQLAWIHPSQADRFCFCPADTAFLPDIRDTYGNRAPL